jgi:DNA-directed RNA polymerase beta subunit
MADLKLNGKFVGNVDDPKNFVENLIEKRRKGEVSKNVNVSYDDVRDTVMVESERGRLRRPLLVVKDGKVALTKKHLEQLENKDLKWTDVLDMGLVEYIDAAEEENCLIAFNESELTKNHTHMEIMALAMFGVCSSLVPFGNHTAPARLSIGAKNQKQAIGHYIGNYGLRIDTDVNLLINSEKPIVTTVMHSIVDFDSHPSGQNFTVAIIAHKGYNMEDAVIINKASIDRGLARSIYFKPYEAEEIRYSGGLIDGIIVPDKEVKGYKSEHDYRLLEADGIIYPESEISEGDVLIGKVSPPRFLSGMDEYNLISSVKRESSVTADTNGTVDFIMLTENEEGNRTVNVRVRDMRKAEIGDKFTSRHGQKGVIGLLVDQTDMPFTASGVVPDLLFSPNGIPSRMTISHLLELIGAKVGALNGRYIDGTTFNCEPEETLRQELLDAGFKENGTETMYNGQTGEMFDAKIYVGSMYYLKLKHMVANRMQSRARGPIQLLTRQPTEG